MQVARRCPSGVGPIYLRDRSGAFHYRARGSSMASFFLHGGSSRCVDTPRGRLRKTFGHRTVVTQFHLKRRSMTADNTAICEIAGGHFLRLRAIALALRGPPLQWPFSTFCAKPPESGNAFRGACSALIGAGRKQTDKFLRSLPHIACHSPNTS